MVAPALAGYRGQCEGVVRLDVAGRGSNHLRDHRIGHGAVVRAMAAAAGWQARIVAGFETGR
jgi:hypothetical protein